MSEQVNGQPGMVIPDLPTAKSIASTTNATPIVVTTSTAHGVKPGDFILITGATDPNANGVFRAGLTASTTQVQLLDKDTGAAVAASGAGGAAGVFLSLGFGVTLQVPLDLTDLRSVAIVNAAFQMLENQDAALLYFLLDKASLTLSNIFTGSQFITGLVRMLGRKSLRRNRVLLSDADQTVDVSQGDIFELTNVPAVIRTITIGETPAPEEEEVIAFIVPGAMATGKQHVIRRASGVVIAEIWGNAAGDAGAYLEVERVGGLWRLGANCSGGAAGGVLPKAGA